MTNTTTRLDADVLQLGAVIVAGSLTAMLDMTMVTVALADLTRTFGTSVTTVQWVSTAYLLAIATVIPTTGRLTERFGTRTMCPRRRSPSSADGSWASWLCPGSWPPSSDR
jgi:MFS family permease